MTANWENYLTENGKSKYEFFNKHNLGKYYEPMMGNLSIDNDEWETVKNDVLQFIAEYWEQQWVLLYNDDCEMWFVTQMTD